MLATSPATVIIRHAIFSRRTDVGPGRGLVRVLCALHRALSSPPMNAIILSIGDELVLGQTVDTNSAWLSQQLAAIGVAVRGHMTVADDQNAIEQAIRDTSSNCDVLLISGGLGPTEDDLTRQALA